MAHLQSSDHNADPSKFGLKFDAGKPRWELVPYEQLLQIVRVSETYVPEPGMVYYPVNIKEFKRDEIVSGILNKMFRWKMGDKKTVETGRRPSHHILAAAAFEVLFLLRGKPYTKEELEQYDIYSQWSLFNLDDIEGVVNVYTMGARKYADNNWQKVSADRYFGAMVRHFKAAIMGHAYDTELGCLHLHQVVWNMLALMWLDDQEKEFD